MLVVSCKSDPEGGLPGPDGGRGGGRDTGSAGARDGGPGTSDLGPGGAPDADNLGCGLVTCQSAGANCGPIGDGCGGFLQCGQCTPPQSCGGGGPSKCGGMSGCVPRTCAALGVVCGSVGDGCGGLLNCGVCTFPQTCGGGGAPNMCGGNSSDAGVCTPRTCASAGANCGPMSDGCGGLLQCGTCGPSQTCGGGGTPNVCGGTPACVPHGCGSANCGPVGDGCGGLVQCGGPCVAPAICGGGGTASVCGGAPDAGGSCINLCLAQRDCGMGMTTSLSGTVYAPTPPQFGMPDPIYNALIYVPNAPVAAFTPGVSCDRCGALASGSPLVSTMSGSNGRFTLPNIPVGVDFPLVIQVGRWRRQITIPGASIRPCTDNPLTAEQTRLPRNHLEGDIPLTAMVTGNVDTLECVLRKIGIDDSEMTPPAPLGQGGRVQFFIANGSQVPGRAPNESALWGAGGSLSNYDLVLFACEGIAYPQNRENRVDQDRVIDYTRRGGRVFATHYSYVWLHDVPPFMGTARWNINQTFPPNPQTGIIDQSFPKGVAFAQWLQTVGASPMPGQIRISDPRHDLDAVVAPAQRWIYTNPPNATIQHYTFNTPLTAPPDQQCGRVVYSDFHVANVMASSSFTYPAECTPGPMTAQEKVLEFMLFDLASCIQPDMPPPPACRQQTCAEAHAQCGLIGDGCGGMTDCGPCPAGQMCGGGGPNMCGGMACIARTCASQGVTCGQAGDGCGNMLECGSCPSGQTCGGGGTPGVCGTPGDGGACMPRSCEQQNLFCGHSGDGCGMEVNCGDCPPEMTCGGGGVVGRCGRSPCQPTSCMAQGANCGILADGCGGVLSCGECSAPQTCGGRGVANVCGLAF